MLEPCAVKVARTVLPGGKLERAYLSDFYQPLEFQSPGWFDTSMVNVHLFGNKQDCIGWIVKKYHDFEPVMVNLQRSFCLQFIWFKKILNKFYEFW